MADNQVTSHSRDAAAPEKEKREEKGKSGKEETSAVVKPQKTSAATTTTAASRKKRGAISAKQRYWAKREEEKAALHFSDDDEEEHEKLSFEGNTPEVGGRAKWLERQRDREGKNKKLSQSKDGTFFSYLFLERIFKESRRCKLCGSSDSGKPFSDDLNSLELYLSERGICGRQRLRCGSCKGVFPVISCDTEAEIPDRPEFKIDSSGVRYYCKKATHFDILHDLMDLLHIAAMDTEQARQEKHYELAEFMIFNAKKVCREWCRPENSELRSKRFLRLRKETLLEHHRAVFTIDHNTEYREMYEMMEGSFRQHRDKIKLLLELLKVTLFDNPTQSAFFLWLSISMIHAECYTQFKERYNPKIYAQVDSTEYQAINERYLGLQVALGVKKIPICLMLFELPRFYHYIEFLRERVGNDRPTKFLTDDDRRTLEKFNRQGQKYLSKRRIRSGKIVSAEAYLELLTAQEMIDKDNMFRGSNDKQKTKLEYVKWQKKYKKDDKQRRLLNLQEGDGKVVKEISDSLDHLEQRSKERKEDAVPFPPSRQRALGPLRERTGLEKDMVAEQILRKPYKSRAELLMEEEDRQWGLDGNWSRKDVLLAEEDMMFERRVCIRFKQAEKPYSECIPASMNIPSPLGRMPTQMEVLVLIDRLLALKMNPVSFDGAMSSISDSQGKRWKKEVEKTTKNDEKENGTLSKPAEREEKEEENELNEEKVEENQSKTKESAMGQNGGDEDIDTASNVTSIEPQTSNSTSDSNKSPPSSSNPHKTETETSGNDNSSLERETKTIISTATPGNEEGRDSDQARVHLTENKAVAARQQQEEEEVGQIENSHAGENECGNTGSEAKPTDEMTDKSMQGKSGFGRSDHTKTGELGNNSTSNLVPEKEQHVSERSTDAYTRIMEMRNARRLKQALDDSNPTSSSSQVLPDSANTSKDAPNVTNTSVEAPSDSASTSRIAPNPTGTSEVSRNSSADQPEDFDLDSPLSSPSSWSAGTPIPDPVPSNEAAIETEKTLPSISPTTSPLQTDEKLVDTEEEKGVGVDSTSKEQLSVGAEKARDNVVDSFTSSEKSSEPSNEKEVDGMLKKGGEVVGGGVEKEEEDEKTKKEEEEEKEEEKINKKEEEEEEEMVKKLKEEEMQRNKKEEEEAEKIKWQKREIERRMREKVAEEERFERQKREIERRMREKVAEEERISWEKEWQRHQPPKKEKKLSKRKEKKMEKKAKQLIEAVQRRKVIEEKYFQERALRRTPSEEAFERLKREKKDCTLAELTPEENQILMNHVRKQKRRDRLEMEEEFDRALMSRRKGKSPAVMRSRLRQKLKDRQKEDDEFYTKLRKKRREREKERGRTRSPSLSLDSSSDEREPPLKPEKMTEIKEKLDKKTHDVSMPKTEAMKSKTTESATKPKSAEDNSAELTKPKSTEVTKPKSAESTKSKAKEMSKPKANDSSSNAKLPEVEQSSEQKEKSRDENTKSSVKETEKEVDYSDRSSSPPLGRYLAVTIKGTSPDSMLLTPDDFRGMLVDHLRANREAEEEKEQLEEEMKQKIQERWSVSEREVRLVPESTSNKDSLPVQPEPKQEEKEEVINDRGETQPKEEEEEIEKEAEKKEKKRRRRNEKKKANKQKKEERQAAMVEQEKAKAEQDKARMELEKAKAELERVKAEQNAESTPPLPKLKEEKITLERRKPKNPEFDIEDYLDEPDMFGAIPLMLTMEPSYITLDDMTDVENQRENKSVGAFIYKASVENGGKDHPFHDIFRFAQLRQTDLDIVIEVSPIQASRNHEDILRLAGKPGKLSYSCKLEVSELCVPVGKKPMSATLPIRPGYPNLAALESTFNEGMYSFAKLAAAASNRITEKKPHVFDFGVKMDEERLVHTELSKKTLARFMESDSDTVQKIMEKELAKQWDKDPRKEKRRKVPKIKDKIAELKTTKTRTMSDKQKGEEEEGKTKGGEIDGKESLSKSKQVNGNVKQEQSASDDEKGEKRGTEVKGEKIVSPTSSITAETKSRPRKTARDKFRRCDNCGEEIADRIQLCSGCKKVAYCNNHCQRAHWKQHKKTCTYYIQKSTQHEQQQHQQQQLQREKPKTCGGCGRELSERILMCAGCKKIAYCDPSCQKLHWKQHKKSCSYSKKKDTEIKPTLS